MAKFDPKNGHYDEAEARYIQQASAGHYDASYSAILARNLQYIRSQVWEVQKAPLHAFEVFPVMTDVPAGAETVVQRIYDTMGIAKIVSNYADDLPRADVIAREESVKVVTIGDSYGYNVRELDNAAFANTNLTGWRARAARRAIDVKLNKLAWFGDAEHNIRGFLNHDNITQVTIAADGNSNGGTNSKKFKHKTPEQIKQEVTSMSASDIEAVIAKYTKAIEAKAAELKKETEKLSNVPLTEQLGDEAKKIRANMADLTKSLDKLKANMEAYADGLKAKK